MPDLKRFERSNKGVYAIPITKPKIAFDDFRKDPVKNKLKTPSGKIEIFSKRLYDMGNPDFIPPIPKYIEEWESPFGGRGRKISIPGHRTPLYGKGTLHARKQRLPERGFSSAGFY
ncbi:MAG: hypothetical protein U5L09_13210 [Bacteroidales bacterium]|nr:hypothetical protein [Bacteroidales bacterium]